MTLRGNIAIQVVSGSFDTFSFFDFIVEDVIPHMNPFPDAESVLVLDNCQIHHSEAL